MGRDQVRLQQVAVLDAAQVWLHWIEVAVQHLSSRSRHCWQAEAAWLPASGSQQELQVLSFQELLPLAWSKPSFLEAQQGSWWAESSQEE